MKPYTIYFLRKVAIFIVCAVVLGIVLGNAWLGISFGTFAAILFEFMFKKSLTEKPVEKN